MINKLIFTTTLALTSLAVNSQTIPCFTVGVGTPTAMIQPSALVTADFNGDGKLDMAVTNYSSGNVSVSFGTGNGSFTAAANYTTSPGPFGIVSGDFNADGKIDLATSNRSSNNISVLLNQGTGTFNSAVSYNAGNTPIALVTRDFTGDGKLDIVTVNNGSNNVSVLTGSGTGTFGAATNFNCGTGPYGIAAADFDLNGTQDLMVTCLSTNVMSQLSGSGTGAFTVVSTPAIAANSFYIAASDFNGDGSVDVAVSSSSGVTVYLSSGGLFSANTPYSVGSSPSGITTGDYNGDGFTDIAIGNGGGATNINVLKGSALGTFGLFTSFPSGTTPMNIVSGDFNADGKPDLATSNFGSNNTSVFINSIAPTVTITPSQASFCAGTTATLTAGGSATSYTWSTGNTTSSIVEVPFFTTTYTVTGTGTNGCLNQAVQTLTVYAVPTLDVTPANSTICEGNSQGISVSGADTYLWNTGSTSTFINVSPTTTTVYTVTGTSVNGCTSQLTTTVTVNPLPVISITTATPVCFGGNLNLINTTTGANAFSWTGPSSFSSTQVNPSIPNITYVQSGTYSLTAVSAAGCAKTNTLTVTVNALPTVAINTATNTVCAGSATTFTASGASTYVWQPGSFTGTTHTYMPVSATTYTVTGTTAQGCAATTTTSISTNPLTAINGSVTASSQPVAGSVTLYEYEPFLTQFDSITTQNIIGTGAYTFTSVPAGSYIVKATPTTNTLQVTYASGAISWQNATVINHNCVNTTTQNINVSPFFSVGSGSGTLSGQITEGQGFGQRSSSAYSPLVPGQPIGGIVVKGGKNPGGNMFAQTTTAANGTYTLSGLPIGNYFILVDIPGLDTNGTYHPVITSSLTQYTNLDFVVDSAKVNPVPPNTTGIKAYDNSIEQISIYPNPASHKATVQYTLLQSSVVSIEICNVIGQTAKPVLAAVEQNADTYRSQLSLEGLKPGMYFIKVKINRTEHTLRLVVSE